MRLNARRSLLLLAACAMSLASVLVYLYWMSRSDESGNYAQARDLIRQIKQYDAQWEGQCSRRAPPPITTTTRWCCR